MKRPSCRLLILLAAAGVIGLPGPPGRGFSYYTLGGTAVVWPGAQALRYLAASTFPPNSTTERLYLGSMGLWMMAPSADFTYFYEPLTFDPVPDPYDGYSDTLAVDAGELDPGVLAVTYMVNSGASWYDMDMLFADYPTGYGWNFEENPGCQSVADPAQYGISFLLVATHELGHAVGLGHDPIGTEPPGSTWFIGTMNPRYPAGGPVGEQAIVEIHADDRNGMRFLYPHCGPAGPMTDLANAGYGSGAITGKAVPAACTPTTAYPGGTLTLGCTLENFGNVNIANVRQGFYLSLDEIIDAGDAPLGTLAWDLPYGATIEFEVEADLPADLAAGTYHVGSILDDLDEVLEEYEDNNTHRYCAALTVGRLAPVFEEFTQQTAVCGQPWFGPTPVLTHPINMNPVTWSLVSPPAGMSIQPQTGVISWPQPVWSPFFYAIGMRATNSAGSSTRTLFLGVGQAPPQIVPLLDRAIPHSTAWTGPMPQLASPDCMNPVLHWSLDSGPAGMQIDYATGVLSWPRARYAAAPYMITIRATNAVGNGTDSFLLSVSGQPGDLNCDGALNALDIDPFVLALTDPARYLVTHLNCDPNLADANGDNVVNALDINAFVRLLTGE